MSNNVVSDNVVESAIGETPLAHVEQHGAGPAVVLLHGWNCSSELWHPIVDRLSDRFHVVSVDFPGCGKTPPPPVVWSVSDYAQWVCALLQRLNIVKAHVIGHSFGGRVGIRLANQWPSVVDKLVLTSSSGIRPRRTFGYHAKVRTYKTLRAVSDSRFAPNALRRWADEQAARCGSPDYRAAEGTVRQSFVRIVNEDQREDLAHIAAPTLIIWGDRDEETPLSDARLMERLIPNAGLVIFEGASHYAYLEQPDRFTHIVRTFFTP